MSEARFTIGVDLGTTNCALSYVDLAASEAEAGRQQTLPVPQLTGPGAVEERSLLPSFLYLPHPDEMASGDLVLPWGAQPDFVLGELARNVGAHHTHPPRLQRQELAVSCRRRSTRCHFAPGGARGGTSLLACGRVDSLPGTFARRMEP